MRYLAEEMSVVDIDPAIGAREMPMTVRIAVGSRLRPLGTRAGTISRGPDTVRNAL